AIPPPDIHKIRRQVTQSFSKSPRFSAMNQKKARPESRADKGLEIFSVNEKVCFGKQKPQYNELTPFH
ncbi:hypothetical protein, partial [Burkholderia pseudomallei]|uniref:hypothetical protein n=1 Tax=Burkholderia pseudomallei TaxID=28450 RepID=UPI001C82CF52